MTDSIKLTAMTAATSAAITDLIYGVINPSTTPVSEKIPISVLTDTVLQQVTSGSNISLSYNTGTHQLTINSTGGGGTGDGLPGCKNLIGVNNTSASATSMDFSADVVSLRSPSENKIAIKTSTGTITCDLTLPASGSTPTANGCDQTKISALTSQWVHFYWIYNGTTLATIASLTAPPTGPTLPSGYTYWAYIGAVRLNASSNLLYTSIQGNKAFYGAAQDLLALTSGSATSETAVSLSTFVPPNALTTILEAVSKYTYTSAGNAQSIKIGYKTGKVYYTVDIVSQAANVLQSLASWIELPNYSQQVYYYWQNATGTRAAYIIVLGYTMPNLST